MFLQQLGCFKVSFGLLFNNEFVFLIESNNGDLVEGFEEP